LFNLTLGINAWAQGNNFTHGVATDSPSVFTANAASWPRRKQAEMGAAEHSWHSERSIKIEYNETELTLLYMFSFNFMLSYAGGLDHGHLMTTS